MDDAKKCYQQYIESEEYVSNDGWNQKIWEIMEVPAKFISKEVFMKYEAAMNAAVSDIEARSFGAGFNAALRLCVMRIAEVNQCSMT